MYIRDGGDRLKITRLVWKFEVCRTSKHLLDKVLILFVRSRSCGELNRGLENLDVPGKGNGFILFACTKRTKSTPKGCDPLDSRGRFKALSKKILAEFSNGTSRNRLFAQNGGEKALNQCEVQALQRKELERTSKERPYSLQTVGYGWVRMGDGGQQRVAWDGDKERLVQIESLWL